MIAATITAAKAACQVSSEPRGRATYSAGSSASSEAATSVIGRRLPDSDAKSSVIRPWHASGGASSLFPPCSGGKCHKRGRQADA
jgi:hypothetical protein